MGIFFGKIFRAILMLLDDAVYGLAEMVYRLFIKIAETGIFSQGSIQEFAGRIYFFLGLAMLFKVSISIIDYIMNPDSVKDNKVGASKLLKNIVTILVGIVAIPYVFEAAYGLQRIILKDNVIGNLILGVKYTDNESDAKSYTEKAGDEMSFAIYNAFFHINEELVDSTCQNGAWEGEDGVFKDDCWPEGKSNQNLDEIKDKYITAYNDKERKKLAQFEIMNATVKGEDGDEEFVFSYMYVVATAAGAFLCYILLLFCFDIAIRSVKLGFLQLIAPIPLISKIDPKKGDEVFSKWVKEVTSTYLLLFIRLVAIYFAIYIVSSLTDTYNVAGHTDEKNLFVNVFMIFGVLLFVKDLPKLVETLTGVKIDGTLSLNKRLRDVPILGKPTAEGIALGGRTMGNIGSGLFRGIKSKDIKSSMGAAWDDIRNDARNYRHGMWSAGKQALGVNDRQLDRLEMEKAKILKKNQSKNNNIKKYNGVSDAIKKMEDRAWDQISTGQSKAADNDGVNLSDKYRALTSALKEAEAGGKAGDIAAAQAKLDGFKQKAIEDYMQNIKSGDDKTFDNLYEDYKKQIEIAEGLEIGDGDDRKKLEALDRTISGSALHSQFGATKGEISKTNREIMDDNQTLYEIEEQQKRIQEDVKSTKPFYTTKR